MPASATQESSYDASSDVKSTSRTPEKVVLIARAIYGTCFSVE